MSIEYSCPTCQARVRTPDGSAGKSARCPQCGGVSVVPGTPAAYAPGLREEQQPTQQPPLQQQPLPQPPPNPFADRPVASDAELNPYASPASGDAQRWPQGLTPEQARMRLMIPAIGMIVLAVIGLGFMALIGIAVAADPGEIFDDADQDQAGRVGVIAFFFSYFTLGLLSRVLQLLGAISMLRLRGYTLALIGAISAIIPCEVYCCLPCFPLGIWALIVLNNAQVKAVFR